MEIAIIADDNKKELMAQFCIAYCGILSQHSLCATGTTGRLVSEATGLQITRYMSGEQGGGQQIAARISCDEIDLVLFFRDPQNPKENDKIRPSLFIIFFNKRLKMNPTKHPIKIEPKISQAKVKS